MTGVANEQIQRCEKGNQEKTEAQPEGKKAIEKGEEYRLILSAPFPERGVASAPDNPFPAITRFPVVSPSSLT
jgi:hypothetical protein